MEQASELSGLRALIDRHRVWVAIVAAVLVATAALAIYNTTSAEPPEQHQAQVYFYDLDNGELFVASSEMVAPFERQGPPESDNTMAVRAYVYSCSKCADKDSRFIAYLEKYTPDAREMLVDPPSESDLRDTDMMERYFKTLNAGKLVRRPDTDEWVIANSPAGLEVVQASRDRCKDGRIPIGCLP